MSEIKIKNAGDREIKVTIQTTRTEFPPTWATVSASDTTLSFDVHTTQSRVNPAIEDEEA